MENFSYPIKLEPLNRPVNRHFGAAQPAAKAPAARKVKAAAVPSGRQPKPKALSLREERERHGVSLEQIAEDTRIPLRHLQELEAGDVSHWPPGIYAKSWARDYADRAGIDPDRVVAIVAPVAEAEPSIDEIKEAREERERTSGKVEAALTPMVQHMRRFAAIALVLTLLALAAVFFFRGGDAPASDQPAPAPVGTSGVTPDQPSD